MIVISDFVNTNPAYYVQFDRIEQQALQGSNKSLEVST
jgi:hypothetical protein